MPRPSHDLTGRVFGRLTAVRRVPGPGRAHWECVCSCGGSPPPIVADSLIRGLSRSCGCLQREYVVTRERPPTFRRKALSLSGLTFGRLTAVSPCRVGRYAGWLCRCDCGGEAVVITSNLTRGNTTSCGCARVEAGKALAARAAERPISLFCRRCGASFAAMPKQYFCSDRCASRYHTEKRWPRSRHHCPTCGTPFLSRADRVYCGDRCRRVAANRAAAEAELSTLTDQALILGARLNTSEATPENRD
jgi:predicted nucleic acid-binding Zn ribbon protein